MLSAIFLSLDWLQGWEKSTLTSSVRLVFSSHIQKRCQGTLFSLSIVGQLLTGSVPLDDGDKASAALMRLSDE